MENEKVHLAIESHRVIECWIGYTSHNDHGSTPYLVVVSRWCGKWNNIVCVKYSLDGMRNGTLHSFIEVVCVSSLTDSVTSDKLTS